jgi:hypothetical protein
MKRSGKAKFGIAWYRPEQWARLLEVSDDSEELETTFAEWEALAEEKFRALLAEGMNVEKVVVDIEELLAWCKGRGFSVDASARSHYVADLLRKQDLH